MRWADFSGGLWVATGNEMEVPGNALITADNVEYMITGGVRGRRGRTAYNASALGGSVVSLWRHYPRTGSPALLAAVDDGANIAFYLGDDSAGTFSAISGGGSLTTGKRWAFANWPAKNKTFMVDGVAMKTYDGSVVAAGPAAAKVGPYIALHNSRLWATTPGEINYSVYASDIDDETTWTGTNHLACNDDQGGSIVGLCSYQGVLLILKTTSLFRYLGDPLTASKLTNYSSRGCIAPLSVQVTPFGVIFVGRDGVYLTDGISSQCADLSASIKSLFVTRAVNQTYGNAIGIWNESKNQYYLKLDPTSSDLYVLTRIQIIGQQAPVWIWSHFTNHPMNCGVAWGSDADKGEVVFGTTDGFVDYINKGVDDKGTPYTSTIRTSARLIDPQQRRIGRVYRTKVLSRGTGALTGALYYDTNSSGVSFDA